MLDFKKIAELLKSCDDEGNTLLHYVASTDDVVFAEKLISAGSNVNAKNHQGDLPLFLAIQANQLEMVKVLINAGADYHVMTRFKESSLHFAAYYGHPEIVQLLLEMGVDVNRSDWSLTTVLHKAACCNDGEKSDDYCKIIKTLINAGANVNAINTFGSTPLLYAVGRGFYSGFELMLSLGADIGLEGKMHFRILEQTVVGSDLRILKRLMELGYDLNMKSYVGSTCLHRAAFSSSEMIEFLIDNGVTMNVDNHGCDPLCEMLDDWSDEYERNVENVVNRDEEIERNGDHDAMIKCIELLIKRGANVNNVTNNGKTTLYVVLERYKCLHSDILRVLLRNGAKMNFNDPLVYEVMNNNESKFSPLLLRHIAMCKAQIHTDKPLDFDINKLNAKSRREYASCQDELELIKETKVNDDTNVTFFDVLVNLDIGPYTRNECIRKVFEEQTFLAKFPIYSDLMIERFSEELKYQSLVQEATNGLSHVLNWDKTSLHVPLSNILLFLDEKDLTNLALI